MTIKASAARKRIIPAALTALLKRLSFTGNGDQHGKDTTLAPRKRLGRKVAFVATMAAALIGITSPRRSRVARSFRAATPPGLSAPWESRCGSRTTSATTIASTPRPPGTTALAICQLSTTTDVVETATSRVPLTATASKRSGSASYPWAAVPGKTSGCDGDSTSGLSHVDTIGAGRRLAPSVPRRVWSVRSTRPTRTCPTSGGARSPNTSSLPRARAGRGPTWGGSKLAADLSLPRLHTRWQPDTTLTGSDRRAAAPPGSGRDLPTGRGADR